MHITSDKKTGTLSFVDKRYVFSITFNRTIRLPEDGNTHSLPPSLGVLPIHLVDDFSDKVPSDWVEHGGVFLPLHQREALWLGFSGSVSAVKVAAGKINAVSGQPWNPRLAPGNDQNQDYLVAPKPQPWLDGFNSGNGVIKQFVGMALGQGYTVEAQVTGEETFGGIQLLVVPPKKPLYSSILRTAGISGQSCNGGPSGQSVSSAYFSSSADSSFELSSCVLSERSVDGPMQPRARLTSDSGTAKSLKSAQIGMAAGGSMRQKIYPDPHGIDTWNQDSATRVFVHIINAEMYREITGEYPPKMPVSAQQYKGYYFDLNDNQMGDLDAPDSLKTVKTVSEMDAKHGFEGQQDDSPTTEEKVITYQHDGQVPVRNGKW